jgi:hypothetical protein
MKHAHCKKTGPKIVNRPTIEDLPEDCQTIFFGQDKTNNIFHLVCLGTSGVTTVYRYFTGGEACLYEGTVDHKRSKGTKTIIHCFYNHKQFEFCLDDPVSSNVHGRPLVVFFPERKTAR